VRFSFLKINFSLFFLNKRTPSKDMSLLQNPVKVLDQIEWFLDNQSQEKFPGAFIRSSGNLSRQLLEQILFILSFYSELPFDKYLKRNNQLYSLDTIWKALNKTNPTTDLTYVDQAKRGSPRIKKFAQLSRSIDKWRKEFNETSHFRNPVIPPKTKEKHMRNFVRRMKRVFDGLDTILITAAVNHLISKGKVMATIRRDPQNTPALLVDALYRPEDFTLIEGKFTLKDKNIPIRIVPSDREVSLLKWKNHCIAVQDSKDILIGMRFLTENRKPLDLTNLSTFIRSFGTAPEMKERIRKRFRRNGIVCEWQNESDFTLKKDGRIIDARNYVIEIYGLYN